MTLTTKQWHSALKDITNNKFDNNLDRLNYLRNNEKYAQEKELTNDIKNYLEAVNKIINEIYKEMAK